MTGPSTNLKRRRPWVRISIAVTGVLALSFLVLVGLKVRRTIQMSMRMEYLYQLNYALSRYADRHGGNYPDLLASLVADGSAKPELLASRYGRDTPATGATTQAIVADLARPGHVSVIYLGTDLTDSTTTPDTVLAYEIPTEQNDQTSVILFLDGRVEFLNKSQTAALMRATSATTRPVKFAIPP